MARYHITSMVLCSCEWSDNYMIGGSMAYWLNNGKKYEVKFEKTYIKVTEFSPMFDGAFYSETDVTRLDNFTEVREYLTEKNGGIEVY